MRRLIMFGHPGTHTATNFAAWFMVLQLRLPQRHAWAVHEKRWLGFF
jgi:hypothetical protein